jgi:WD40 repeat protein
VTLAVDGTARIWDANTGDPISPSLPYSVSKYRPETTEIIGTRPGEEACVAFSPDGDQIAIGGWDGIVRIWDLTNRELISGPFKAGVLRRIELPAFGLSPLIKVYGRKATDITPEGLNVFVDERYWSMATGMPREPLNFVKVTALGKKASPLSFSFLKQKEKLLAVSIDGLYELKSIGAAARVWDATNKQPITRPLQHQQEISSGAFSSDGKWVATAGKDKTVRVWQVNTSHPLTPFLRSSEQVHKIWFSTGNTRLYALCNDGTAWIWNLSPDKRELERLIDLTQYLSANKMDHTGTFVDLEVESFRDDWFEIKKRFPEDFKSVEQNIIAWHRHRASSCENKNNWPGAILHLNWLIHKFPEEWPLYLRRGRAHEELIEPARAIADYTHAIDLGADDWLVWFGRSQVYLQIYRWEKATDDYLKAIEYGAPYEVALGDAVLLSAIIDQKDTINNLADKISDDQLGGYTTQALVKAWALRAKMTEDIDNAISKASIWFEQNAVELAPLYFREGRFEEALKIHKTYFDQHPRTEAPWHRIFMAMSQYQLGAVGEAHENLRRVKRWIRLKAKQEPPQKYFKFGWRQILPVKIILKEAEGMMAIN